MSKSTALLILLDCGLMKIPAAGTAWQDLLGRTDNTAWACRATGRLSAFSAWVSHTVIEPLSRPTRAASGARFLISRAMAMSSGAT
jgi:hypothetical protein